MKKAFLCLIALCLCACMSKNQNIPDYDITTPYGRIVQTVVDSDLPMLCDDFSQMCLYNGKPAAMAGGGIFAYDVTTIYLIGTLPTRESMLTEQSLLLGIKVSFMNESWIFMDEISFLADGKTISWTLPNPKREVTTGRISEIQTMFLTPKQIEEARLIANASSLKIRLSGSKGVRDLPNKSIQEKWQEIIAIYDEILHIYAEQ